jgi:sterol desaturase/sphingolipid hydroxylase (fatty acid hydroxylase superfamily)
MMAGRLLSWLIEVPLFVTVVLGTHLVMSFGQTLMHYWLGHRRYGGAFFRNHIKFHHGHYARGHLTSSVALENDDNNTPFFAIPVLLAGVAAWFALPHALFFAVPLGAAASFFMHVWLDRAYHVEGSWLERFAWFRRKQQQHFVHHLHANCNFAVVDFFWDRVLGTYRKPDGNLH